MQSISLLVTGGCLVATFIYLLATMREHRVWRTLYIVSYLGFIALIPFPTGLLADRGDEAPAVIVYAITLAAVTSLGATMELYAERRGLAAPRQRRFFEYANVPGVFLLSIPIALLSPTLAIWSWLLLFVTGRVSQRMEAARR